jgi:hypothetical protein
VGGGDDFVEDAPVELLCEEDGVIVSGPTCGNGQSDPGEICFERNELVTRCCLTSITHGDIDEDGAVDLVVTDERRVDVYWGAEEDPFAESTRYDAPPFAPIMRTADVNGDGHLDIVGFDHGAPTSIVILALLGNGTRDLTVSSFEVAGDRADLLLTARDVDGDGFDDLALFNSWEHRLVFTTAFGAEGDGALADSEVTTLSDPVPSLSNELFAVANVDASDGLELLLLADAVRVHSWSGDSPPPYAYDPELPYKTLTAADVDGDDLNDLVLGWDSFLAIARGEGDGTFGTQVSTPLGYFQRRLFLVGGRFGAGPSVGTLAVVQTPWISGPSAIIAFASFVDDAMEVSTCYGVEFVNGNALVDVADLNGDGIDDIVLLTGDGIASYESQR